VELNEENCTWIIREPKNYFRRNYVFSEKEFCEFEDLENKEPD
jgi:hypothetical protein